MDEEHLFDKLGAWLKQGGQRYIQRTRRDSLTSTFLSFFMADEAIHRVISCARSNSINDLGHQAQWLLIFVNEYAQQILDIILMFSHHPFDLGEFLCSCMVLLY